MSSYIYSQFKNGDYTSGMQLELFNKNELFNLVEDNNIYTVRDNDKVVGFVLFYRPRTGVCDIDAIETVIKNDGIGTKIVNDFKSFQCIDRIQVTPNSAESSRFWKKLGFNLIADLDLCWRR